MGMPCNTLGPMICSADRLSRVDGFISQHIWKGAERFPPLGSDVHGWQRQQLAMLYPGEMRYSRSKRVHEGVICWRCATALICPVPTLRVSVLNPRQVLDDALAKCHASYPCRPAVVDILYIFWNKCMKLE